MTDVGIVALIQSTGLRCLTEAGLAERVRRVRAEKRARGIHHSTNCYDEDWYVTIERDLLQPQHRGVYWDYAQVAR